MDISNYYFHSILKDNKDSKIYDNFEKNPKRWKIKIYRLVDNELIEI